MNEHSRIWSLQEAKAKFSEVVRRARTEGPQTVTVHGTPMATVAAIDASHPAEDDETGQVIVDAFRSCPVKDFEVLRVRDHGPLRDVDV